MCSMFLPELASFVSSMLFAVHPIHTEAVSFELKLIIISNLTVSTALLETGTPRNCSQDFDHYPRLVPLFETTSIFQLRN